MDLSMLSNEQDKRNFIRNSDVNLFVEAGPGAGKTTFISRRIINQIKKGISPDNFVFVAFTKEAAQEIRDKIKKNIKRDLVKAEGEEEEILALALVNLPNMSIMTIYELCINILEKAGVDTSVYHGDFSDLGMKQDMKKLLIDTMECLRTGGDFLSELKKVYTHIYVDEYQDTNELQTAILWMLATDDSGEHLRDDALFLVGDEKQSIYLQEGADVSVFKRIRERMRDMENAAVITLYENYRSEEQIINFINDRFSALFEDYAAAKKDWKIKKENSFHGIMCVEQQCEEYNTLADISLTCKLIHKLISSENELIEDKKTGELRRIVSQDFLVIINREEHLEKYQTAIANAGIAIGEDGVKVMSIRDVKGLSADLVIIADRSISKEEYFECEALTKEQEDEWTRFEYVALTRARHAIMFLPAITCESKFTESYFRLEELPVFKV